MRPFKNLDAYPAHIAVLWKALEQGLEIPEMPLATATRQRQLLYMYRKSLVEGGYSWGSRLQRFTLSLQTLPNGMRRIVGVADDVSYKIMQQFGDLGTNPGVKDEDAVRASTPGIGHPGYDSAGVSIGNSSAMDRTLAKHFDLGEASKPGVESAIQQALEVRAQVARGEYDEALIGMMEPPADPLLKDRWLKLHSDKPGGRATTNVAGNTDVNGREHPSTSSPTQE